MTTNKYKKYTTAERNAALAITPPGKSWEMYADHLAVLAASSALPVRKSKQKYTTQQWANAQREHDLIMRSNAQKEEDTRKRIKEANRIREEERRIADEEERKRMQRIKDQAKTSGIYTWTDPLKDVAKSLSMTSDDIIDKLNGRKCVSVTFMYDNKEYAYRPLKTQSDWYYGLCRVHALVNGVEGITSINYHIGYYSNLPRPNSNIAGSNRKYRSSSKDNVPCGHTQKPSDELVESVSTSDIPFNLPAFAVLPPFTPTKCGDSYATTDEFNRIAIKCELGNNWNKTQLKRTLLTCGVKPSDILTGNVDTNIFDKIKEQYPNEEPRTASKPLPVREHADGMTNYDIRSYTKRLLDDNLAKIENLTTDERVRLICDLMDDPVITERKYPCGKKVVNTMVSDYNRYHLST